VARIKMPNDHSKALRQKLDEIGRSDVSLHRKAIKDLSKTLPHSIKHIGSPPHRYLECAAYALEIPICLVESASACEIYADFAKNALPGLLRDMPGSETCDGEVVLYFRNGKAKHVGRRIEGDRVISKWGKNPIYEHAIAEVPACYGDEHETFKRPSVSYVTNQFIDFVRKHERYEDILPESFEERVRKLKGLDF
jgi:hypothetical protein